MTSARHAITALAEAGLPVRVIATEIKTHRSTVYRWRSGARRPSARNLAALRTLVDDLRRGILAGHVIADARQLAALDRAAHWLTPESERADTARLADSIRLTMQRAGRPPPAPVTTEADAFALCRADDLDAQIDALFPLAA